MSQQGDRRTGSSGQGDDWWGQLYDESTEDTGPAAAPDTLDDRFASAAGAVTGPPPPLPVPPQDPVPQSAPPPGKPLGKPSGKPTEDAASYTPPRAPWEPLPDATAPTTFGPGRRIPDEADGAAGTGEGSEDPADPAEPDPGHPDPAAATVPPARTPESAAAPPVPVVGYVGDGPPTYDPEPTALPAADPDELDELVADTVLDGARYGSCTLRAASVRGDSARYRGEPRRDSLLTARFGTGDTGLVLVAMATGARATAGAHLAAAEACHWIGRAVGRSHTRLVDDIRGARRGDLKSGLHRLTDRSLGKLRAAAAEQGVDPEEYTATSLRCLLIPADPECRTRVFFGVGGGGLFRLRDGTLQDIEPQVTEATGEPVVGFGSVPPAGSAPSETPEGDRLTLDLGITTPPSPYEPAVEPPRAPFRFRASVARPGDTLLLCTPGLAEPLRGEPRLAGRLLQRWGGTEPPGLAAFLADTQLRVKGYADDRTACAIWEA
ncbi:protein phosphatase 2C domain-containing protein [Streptomyces monticola]|uniref:Protein phosphatase 2C domain-containing protein n=1 Tax=Streptomyces monticola TaxID=2666263 RepID=A0ABW2JBR8_9ACTN